MSTVGIMELPVICLFGSTASGKTDLAIKLFKEFPLDIINVDSAQIYRGMNIGTAKPKKEILNTSKLFFRHQTGLPWPMGAAAGWMGWPPPGGRGEPGRRREAGGGEPPQMEFLDTETKSF